MKSVVCLVLFLFFSNSFSQNVSPQFSELKGMEDQSGNTHLFYRIYTYFANDPIYETHNDIYHFDLETLLDSLFLIDYSHSSPPWNSFLSVKDYEFWNNDFTKFIFGGAIGSWEPSPYIKRFDEDIIYLDFFQGEINQIDISGFEDSLLFAGGWLIDLSNGELKTIKSTDGGINWNVVSDTLHFLSMNPYNENVLFAVNEDDELYKSSDSGDSFYIVDTVGNYNWDEFFYDKDQHHIYRKTFVYPYNSLIVSSNNGEPFSWEIKNQYDSQIQISLDDSISGTIYLANKKNIYLSTNYGDNFNLYKSLAKKIVGIYKKPSAGGGSNKLYAATKYKIYEITPDTISVIKNLPIPEEVLNYYPLAVGNKWVYTEKMVVNPYIEYSVEVIEVLKDSLAPNGKLYFHLRNAGNHFLERVDSSEGKVYRYFESTNLPENEYMIDDLLAEVGDTVNSFRMRYPSDYSYTIVEAVNTFNKWGLTKPRKVFRQVPLYTAGLVYSLTQDIGLDYLLWDYRFATTTWTLNGCVINGVVYGDTMLVSVENETENIPTEFSLSQNYPNPFNPTTTIKFTIPTSPLNPSPYQGEGHRERLITLKVYDILGNEIATLVNEESAIGGAGSYEVEFSGKGLPSGVYFYQLRAGGFVDTKKLILIK